MSKQATKISPKTLAYFGLTLVLSTTLYFVATPCAFAESGDMTLVELAQKGWSYALAYQCITAVCSFITNFAQPLINGMFSWGLDFMSIPFVNQIILWLQILSATAVVIIRVATAIRTNLLHEGGSKEVSTGEFFFKSIWALVMVAIMPTACRMVITFGKAMFDDLILGTGGAAGAMSWFSLEGLTETGIENLCNDKFVGLWMTLGILLICILAAACGYQFIRRQAEMLTTSIIAPVIAVFSATENDTNQVTDMFKSLFGLVCQQWLQFVLVMLAISSGQRWISYSLSTGGLETGVFSAETAQYFMWSIALFMVALTIPKLVDRYTFGASGGSRFGAVMASSTAMRASRMIRIPRLGGK